MKHSIAPSLKVLLGSLACCAQVGSALAQSTPLAPLPLGDIAVTEILANAINESTGEFVEVINTSDTVLDLSQYGYTDNSGLVQTIVPFPRALAFGTPTTSIGPDQVALILDKDYAGEYDQRVLDAAINPSVIAVVTTSQGYLSLANSADSVAITGPSGTVSDSFSWTNDIGSEIPWARLRKISGELDGVAVDSQGLSIGYVRDEEIPVPQEPPTIIISEVLPDPVGTDDGEFIEIKNVGTSIVHLEGAALRDLAGDTFQLTGELPPDGFATYQPTESKITLNNSGDLIELIFKTGVSEETLDSVNYPAATEGHSWSRFSSVFAWTTQATPGQANVLVEPTPPTVPSTDSEGATTDDDAELEDDAITYATIREVIKADEGIKVKVRGTVIANLGTFFPKNFHVQDKSGGLLVKIPLDFEITQQSALVVGQEVELVGKTAKYRDMPRLLLTDEPKVVGKKNINAQPISIGAIADAKIGELVTVRGQVIQRSGRSFKVEQGKDALLVSVRSGSGITTKAPPKNSSVQVTGIVLRSGKQLVLAPRFAADLGGTSLVPSGNPITPTLLIATILALLVFVRYWGPRSIEGSIKKF